MPFEHPPSRQLRPLWLLPLCLLAAGCGSVQPWEKARFADYTMLADRDPLAASMRSHIHYTRESASGGMGVGGGGCGCN
jgi:hypothetical protein